MGCESHPGTVIVIVTVVNAVHGALVLIVTEVEHILRLEGGGEREGEREREGDQEETDRIKRMLREKWIDSEKEGQRDLASVPFRR